MPLPALTAAAVCLISVMALSQTSKMGSGLDGLAFTVDMEKTVYKDDGTVTRALEICAQFPGMRMRFAAMPCWSRSRNLLDAIEFMTLRFAPSFILRPETQREATDRQSFIKAGCIESHDVVLGYENVAGFRTVKVLADVTGSGRRTNWYAPDLGCFPMQRTVEKVGFDGKIHMRSRDIVLRFKTDDKAPRPSQ